MFLQIIASANDLVDCGERPDGSSGASRLLTLKHVKQMVNKRGKHILVIDTKQDKYPQTFFGTMG